MATGQDHVPGLSRGKTNESLFASGNLVDIDWIKINQMNGYTEVRLLPLAKRPKAESEQYPPTFTTDEILMIAQRQLPSPRTFQHQDVYVDGICPVALALRMTDICRFARRVFVNVPREGGWKQVAERPCTITTLAVGDRVRCRVFGNEVVAEVKAISDTGLQVAEIGRRRAQRVWVYEGHDLLGWA
jgi:hypothetical protein